MMNMITEIFRERRRSELPKMSRDSELMNRETEREKKTEQFLCLLPKKIDRSRYEEVVIFRGERKTL